MKLVIKAKKFEYGMDGDRKLELIPMNLEKIGNEYYRYWSMNLIRIKEQESIECAHIRVKAAKDNSEYQEEIENVIFHSLEACKEIVLLNKLGVI